jgi:metal-responsive CopG/Arc/MetJ family transcriptional regulator
MATIKTAISINKDLFNEVEALSHKIHLSRSQIFSQAVQDLIERKENLSLLQKLNEAYGSDANSEDKIISSIAKRANARLAKETWK